LENIDNYYNIINNIYGSFELKKRNYEILNNINEINNNDLYKDLEEIINENKIQNKFYKINIIYNKMKNDLQKNLESNFNFSFLKAIPKSINSCENGINRLIEEFNELKKGISWGNGWNPGFELWTLNNNIFKWIFTLQGLYCTPYSGGKFYIKVLFPDNYPNSSPSFFFVTPIYHFNVINIQQYGDEIDPLGEIKLLGGVLDWNPNTKIKDIIIDIFSYFWGGNPDNAFSFALKALYKKNLKLYNRRIKYFTKKYADPSFPYKEYDSWDFSVPDELK
jgi:ubiquitin-protein ligase